jgi:hypothetical protein
LQPLFEKTFFEAPGERVVVAGEERCLERKFPTSFGGKIRECTFATPSEKTFIERKGAQTKRFKPGRESGLR